MSIFLIILISFSISIFISLIKSLNIKLNVYERSIISTSVGWCLVIYSLILAFAINSFYTRYLDIRTIITNKASSIELLYSFLKVQKKSEQRDKTILALSKYLSEISSELYSNINNYDKIHKELNDEIIKCIGENPNSPYNYKILADLSTEQQLKKIFDEIQSSNYYISILIFLFLIVLIPISFTTSNVKYVQFMVDFCVITILISGLSLAYFLANPFVSSPISINLNFFSDLSKDIDVYLKTY